MDQGHIESAQARVTALAWIALEKWNLIAVLLKSSESLAFRFLFARTPTTSPARQGRIPVSDAFLSILSAIGTLARNGLRGN